MRPAPSAALLVLAAALLVSGCGPNRVEPPSRFPKPLLQPVALAASLSADAAFSGYVHEEKLPPPGTTWRLSVGPTSVDWMRNLLSAAFARVVPADRADLVFVPSIDKVQFSTPAQSRTEFYEAWIRYTVTVRNRHGATVATWPIAAYGKHRDGTLASATDGMGEALNQAMRDGAAALALQLRDPQALGRLAAATPPPAAAGAAGAHS